MKQRPIRIAELPFSFVGTAVKDKDLKKLITAFQQNNDHIMSQMRKLARELTDANKAIDELTALLDSIPEDDDD